jgi:uncharacterized protein YbcC (UPF0753/DUF2309 family)
MNTQTFVRKQAKAAAQTGAEQTIAAAVARATQKIAPLWPLKHFVAVNPFLGLSHLEFSEAAGTMAQVAGARMTMPRRFYTDAIGQGRVTEQDLAEALAEAGSADGLPQDVAALRALAFAGDAEQAPDPLPTVADVAGKLMGEDWARLMVDRISAWAAAYFDEGQASWRSPWRKSSPYAAWRAESALDRTPELMGIGGFRAVVKRLPETAQEAAQLAIARLGVPQAGLDGYLHRLLMSIAGWAGYARYRVWESELYGQPDDTLTELLSVRLALDLALYECCAAEGLDKAWAQAREKLAAAEEVPSGAAALAADVVLQSAYEKAWQRGLVAKLSARKGRKPAERKVVQAAFCIDVRSEVFRRAFEAVAPKVETVGFAGFFGFPIEYVPLGHERGRAQCPVLLKPKFTVYETVAGADEDAEAKVLGLRLLRRRAAKAWKSFKLAAVSSFGFVETAGLGYAGKLVTDSLGATRTVKHPDVDGVDGSVALRLRPRLEAREVGGCKSGFDHHTRLAMAEAVLRAMSMTQDFARLVMLTGHGATTVNNPHATGLDCGACGGHSGEANARVAAGILNDPAVRTGLAAKGISIPDDTVFLGCLHDTTTDEITIFDEETVPESHAADLARLKDWLVAAGRLARTERAQLLSLGAGQAVDAAVIGRSRDWSQVRPEWGLAGCAAFIAAPRQRTEGVDLGGRAFLHSYDWRKDDGFDVLELIMTAPMVVASWISLQYYGSTVDNRVFGSGNKVLHNVVGSTLGVFEGNGGDLRVGLPQQSVHDGERFIHEPVRLSVMIEAPVEAMNAVIARHEPVRQLVDNGWLHLFAIDESGAVSQRYAGGLQWVSVAHGEASLAA